MKWKGKEKRLKQISLQKKEYMAVMHSIYHILQLEIKSFYYFLELFWSLRKPLNNHVAAKNRILLAQFWLSC